jgi:hypothetical protein
MSISLRFNGPTPRFVKIIRICQRFRERHIRGVGDTMTQRRTLARLQKFDRIRREECPTKRSRVQSVRDEHQTCPGNHGCMTSVRSNQEDCK